MVQEGDTGAAQQTLIDAISSKLSSLAASIAEALVNINCPPGSECYKKTHTQKLTDKFNKAKTNLQLAPLELSLAEKNMYEYNKGEPGGVNIYQPLIFDRYANTAQELQQNSMDKQQEFMADLTLALRQYQSEQLFNTRTNELLHTRQKERDDLLRKTELYNKILQTSERKVIYEIKDMSSIYMFRRVMLFFYYAAIVIYIIFGNFIPDKLYMKLSVWLIVVIVCVMPVILNILMKWIIIISSVIAYWFKNEMPHRDVYADL